MKLLRLEGGSSKKNVLRANFEIRLVAVSELDVADGTQISVKWRRGSRKEGRGQTAAAVVQGNRAALLAEIRQSCTLRPSKEGFQRKLVSFSVRRAHPDGTLASTALGRGVLDLAQLASSDGAEHELQVSLESCKLQVKVAVHWERAGKLRLLRRVGLTEAVDRHAVALSGDEQLADVYGSVYVVVVADDVDDTETRSTDSSLRPTSEGAAERSSRHSVVPLMGEDLHARVHALERESYQRLKTIGENERTMASMREKMAEERAEAESALGELRRQLEIARASVSEMQAAAANKTAIMASQQQKIGELRELLEERHNSDDQLLQLRSKQETILTLETELAGERTKVQTLRRQLEELTRASKAAGAAAAAAAAAAASPPSKREDSMLTALENQLPPETFARFSLLLVTLLIVYIFFFV